MNATTGGLNCPQFSEIDLDGDGIKDLVSFERNFYGAVKTFLNTGTNGNPSYTYAPATAKPIFSRRCQRA